MNDDNNPLVAPSMTLTQMGAMLQELSNPEVEAFLEVRHIKGKPIAILRREEPEFIPEHLRRRA